MPPLTALLDGLPSLPRHAALSLDFETRQQAGVSVILRAADPVDILFIKRADNPRDPWSGHMALPGGRREDHDDDLLATAIRETLEETRIQLSSDDFVGRLPRVAPRGPGIPTIVVVPFLFTVPATTTPVAALEEVERTRWVALHELRDQTRREPYPVRLPAGERTFPSIRMDGDIIWGMTFRIVEDLLLLLDGHEPAKLRDRDF